MLGLAPVRLVPPGVPRARVQLVLLGVPRARVPLVLPAVVPCVVRAPPVLVPVLARMLPQLALVRAVSLGMPVLVWHPVRVRLLLVRRPGLVQRRVYRPRSAVMF